MTAWIPTLPSKRALPIIRGTRPRIIRSTRLVAIVAIVIVAILALTYVTRDGDDGSLVILHSNDTHCHYDDGLGLSTLKALKDSMESKGDAVFVVDTGCKARRTAP